MADIGTKVFTLPHGILSIQSAQVSDAEEFLEYILKVYQETDFLTSTPDEFDMTVEDERRFIEDRLLDPKGLLLTARYQGILVGSLGVNPSHLKRYSHKISFGISLLKDYWGLGIGRKLIETLLEWADASGIIKVSLEVDTLNTRAIRLYQSMGFKEEGYLKMDRRMENMEFRDSLIMARFNPYYCKRS
jgi:RimJ/RimL family protein N-acetyltransferase